MHRYTIVVDGKPFTLDVRELGADQFRVQVDGRELDVRLGPDEELPEGTITPAMPQSEEDAARSALPPSEERRAEPRLSLVKPAPRASASAGASTLTAPMPGVIVSVSAKAGAAVSRGDVLVTLEAMKMRNDIRAVRDAVVDEVVVQEGQSVAFGELLVRFRATP